MNGQLPNVLDRFRSAAQAFVGVVDSAATQEREAFLIQAGDCLAELYGSALKLPPGEPVTDEISGESFDADALVQLARSLRAKLGEMDSYWSVFDATDEHSQVRGSLAGDISEVYADVRDGLGLFGKPAIAEGDLLWELRFDFRSHWGRHALDALKAIYDRHVE